MSAMTAVVGSMEALGLTWADVDFERSVIRIHWQLSRYREHARLKTEAANREVLLARAIVRLLREQWLASPSRAPMTSCSPRQPAAVSGTPSG
jgi:integrase